MSMKKTMCEFVHGLDDKQACARITELQQENAELRELIRRMEPFVMDSDARRLIERDMARLGMEVD